MKRIKKILCLMLVLMLVGSSFHVSAASPKLNQKSVTLRVGESCVLKVKNTKKKVKWKSGNKKIATVSSKGKVVAKSSGSTTVTATVGKKKYKCKVCVLYKRDSYVSPSYVSRVDFGRTWEDDYAVIRMIIIGNNKCSSRVRTKGYLKLSVDCNKTIQFDQNTAYDYKNGYYEFKIHKSEINYDESGKWSIGATAYIGGRVFSDYDLLQGYLTLTDADKKQFYQKDVKNNVASRIAAVKSEGHLLNDGVTYYYGYNHINKKTDITEGVFTDGSTYLGYRWSGCEVIIFKDSMKAEFKMVTGVDPLFIETVVEDRSVLTGTMDDAKYYQWKACFGDKQPTEDVIKATNINVVNLLTKAANGYSDSLVGIRGNMKDFGFASYSK